MINVPLLFFSYADERSMYETQLVELRQRLMDLQAKFNSLSAFSENKDDMERQLASYQVRIASFRTLSLAPKRCANEQTNRFFRLA